MITLAQVVWEAGLSKEVFEWRFEGCRRAGCRKIWGKGVPGSGNNKCKGPEAEKRLTCKKKRQKKGVPGAERKARGTRDGLNERSEEGFKDLIDIFLF